MSATQPQHKTGIHLSRYVRYMVADYAPLGKTFTLTIKWVTEADWYNKKTRQSEKVPSIAFEETPAQLKLTSHDNCRMMARLYGPDADNWIGKVIIIRAEEMAMGDGEGGKKRTIQIIGEGKKAAPKPQTAVTATSGNGNDWNAASIDDLRAWAIAHHINDESITTALEQAGGLISEAHVLLGKMVVTR